MSTDNSLLEAVISLVAIMPRFANYSMKRVQTQLFEINRSLPSSLKNRERDEIGYSENGLINIIKCRESLQDVENVI